MVTYIRHRNNGNESRSTDEVSQIGTATTTLPYFKLIALFQVFLIIRNTLNTC